MGKITAAAILVASLSSSGGVAARGPLVVDLDGDGSPETVALRQHANETVVTIEGRTLRGGKQTLSFGVDPARQDAVCGVPVVLEVAEPECVPEALGAEPLEGCKATRPSQDLMLSDGMCDPIHMYWNHVEKQVWWWRA